MRPLFFIGSHFNPAQVFAKIGDDLRGGCCLSTIFRRFGAAIGRMSNGSNWLMSRRDIQHTVVTFLTGLLLVLVTQSLVARFGGEPGSRKSSVQTEADKKTTPEELISPFAIPGASDFIRNKVHPISTVHLLHIVVLGLLIGQLRTAYRYSSERYLIWLQAVCLLLTVSYGLEYLFSVSTLTLALRPPDWIRATLSALSSLALVGAGIHANRPRESWKRLAPPLLVFGALVGIALTISTFYAKAFSLPVPIAAASLTGCAACARGFRRAARPYGRGVQLSLVAGFGMYGLVHLMEPLTYAPESRVQDIAFLFGFVTKTLAILAVVALALAKSHTELSNSLAREKHEKRLIDELLSRTRHAFYQDTLEGVVSVSHGEEALLGRLSDNDRRMRRDYFEVKEEFEDYAQKISTVGVFDGVVRFRDFTGVGKIVLLNSRREQSFVEGFYYDVTHERLREESIDSLSDVIAALAKSVTFEKAVDELTAGVARVVGASAALYLVKHATDDDRGAFLHGVASPRDSRQSSAWTPLPPFEACFEAAASSPGKWIEMVQPLLLGGRKKKAVRVLGLASLSYLDTGRPDGVLGFLCVEAPVPPDSRFEASLSAIAQLRSDLVVPIEMVLMRQIVSELEEMSLAFSSTKDTRGALGDSLDGIVRLSAAQLLGVGAVVRQGTLVAVSAHRNESPALELSPLVARMAADQRIQMLPSVTCEAIEVGGNQHLLLGVPLAHVGGRPFGRLLVIGNARKSGAMGYSLLDVFLIRYRSRLLAAFLEWADSERNFRSLAQMMSHEFRSAITDIRNRALYLRKERHRFRDPNRIDRILEDIDGTALELEHLVDQIDVFREQACEAESWVNLYEDVIQPCIAETRHWFYERQSEPPTLRREEFFPLPKLRLKKTALSRAVKNLLVNMAKYGSDRDAHRAPRVLVEVTDSSYSLVFQDWGIGVPDADQDKVFDAGYRSPGAATIDVEGKGLGLFIARKLVEEETGGTLRLTNGYKPTEFRIALPSTLRRLAK